MALPPNLGRAPGMPSGPTDLFLPIIASRFLTMLILMVKDFIHAMRRKEINLITSSHAMTKGKLDKKNLSEQS
jgi:hypothetical protein